jgi:hypothetical protein
VCSKITSEMRAKSVKLKSFSNQTKRLQMIGVLSIMIML